MGYRKPGALEQLYYIIKYETTEAIASLRLRLKLWLTKKTDCKRCCLRCEYLSKEVKYKGYTVVQSGLNNHISIYASDGHFVYHSQAKKKQTEQELRETVDFYLKLIKEEL